MPKGPKIKKPPADVIGEAATAMHVDMGEAQVAFPVDDGKDKAAQSLGQRGGRARAKALSAKRRKEIARKAAATRWKP
jgi:hypothetical protein